MILREVLRQVVTKLDLEDEIAIDDEIVTGDTAKKLLLVSNNVIREIASCYLPLLERERVKIENNRLDLTTLGRSLIKVISLKNESGNNVRFKMYPTYMYAQNGVFDIVYSYLPSEINIDDVVEVDSRVSSDILANAIISEYMIMRGDVKVAEYYDRKYREGLKNLCVEKREIKLKGRVFI